jgi:hypothetical protein
VTGARAGTGSRHIVGSAVSAVAPVMLTAQVASESHAVSAFDAGARALADRSLAPRRRPPNTSGRDA